MCACVCLPLRLLITSGMMWFDMNSIYLVKQGLQLLHNHMAAVVVIGGGRGLRIKVHPNQPNKSKLLLYSHYFHFK